MGSFPPVRILETVPALNLLHFRKICCASKPVLSKHNFCTYLFEVTKSAANSAEMDKYAFVERLMVKDLNRTYNWTDK